MAKVMGILNHSNAVIRVLQIVKCPCGKSQGTCELHRKVNQ